MPNTHITEFGVVQFMPIETFNDPTRGLDKDARSDRFMEAFASDGPPRLQNVGDWPWVHTAILRDGVFVIETSPPSFTATLHFCPERPDAGDYEIHYRPRGRVEKGRTVKITAVDVGETDTRVSMLTLFATRYAVVTVGSERPHARMMWLVGLKDYRRVHEADDTDDGVFPCTVLASNTGI